MARKSLKWSPVKEALGGGIDKATDPETGKTYLRIKTAPTVKKSQYVRVEAMADELGEVRV